MSWRSVASGGVNRKLSLSSAMTRVRLGSRTSSESDSETGRHSSTQIVALIEGARRGDEQALATLLPLVYDEMRRLAARYLRRERPGQTLQATALVHEV